MRVGKLYAAIDLIAEEFSEYEIEQKLTQLQSALNTSVTSPNEQNTQAFRGSYAEVGKVLESCDTNNATPTQRRILDEIGATQYIGKGLWEKISTIIADNNITPANALQEIITLNKEVHSFHESVAKLNKEFENLDLEYDELESGEAEIGIAIPPEMVKSNLDGLKEEIREFDRIFKVFRELKGESVESSKIRSISSSDFQLFLESAPVVAAVIAAAIERIVAIYKNLLEIKKLRENLAKQKVPKEATKGIEDHEKQVVNKELEELAKSLIKENYKGDDGRKNELKNALKMALGFLADRIDRGVLVEVRVAEPEKPEEAEESEEGKKATTREIKAYEKQKQLAENINRQGRSLARLERGSKPILLLSSKKSKQDKEK
ncbi:MAG: hypothetical protein GWP15_03230 [Nitrospirae bacterium]|nr:hypothetical protein [Nitrospirota bacterium]